MGSQCKLYPKSPDPILGHLMIFSVPWASHFCLSGLSLLACKMKLATEALCTQCSVGQCLFIFDFNILPISPKGYSEAKKNTNTQVESS